MTTSGARQMRTLVLVVTLSLIGLSALAPTSQAFGWCVKAGKVQVEDHTCQRHIVCVGWSYDSRGERCQYGVPPPYCTCPPMMVLP